MARPNRVRVHRDAPHFDAIERIEADRRARVLRVAVPDGVEYRYDVGLDAVERGLRGDTAAEFAPLLPGVMPEIEEFTAEVYADAVRALPHRRARLRVLLA